LTSARLRDVQIDLDHVGHLRGAAGASVVEYAWYRLAPMPMVVVEERFDPPVDLSKPNPVAEKVSPCLGVEGVEWKSSFIAADGSRCVCVYEAPDADAVRRVYRKAGVGFERVFTVVHLAP
jgi:hypothetical protein